MSSTPRKFTGWTFALVAGCAELVPGTPIPLVDLTALEPVTGSADPFAGEGGADVACPAGSVQVADFGGETAFDVSTDGCPRVTVAAPSLVPVLRDDVIVVRAWHDPLYAGGEVGATAVLALAIGGDEVWRAEIAIPQPVGDIALGSVPAPRGWPEGAQVSWHVHNHGKNSYHLLDVAVRPLVPERLAQAE